MNEEDQMNDFLQCAEQFIQALAACPVDWAQEFVNSNSVILRPWAVAPEGNGFVRYDLLGNLVVSIDTEEAKEAEDESLEERGHTLLEKLNV